MSPKSLLICNNFQDGHFLSLLFYTFIFQSCKWMIYITVKFRGKYKFNTSWRVSLPVGPKEWWVRENTPSSEDSGREDSGGGGGRPHWAPSGGQSQGTQGLTFWVVSWPVKQTWVEKWWGRQQQSSLEQHEESPQRQGSCNHSKRAGWWKPTGNPPTTKLSQVLHQSTPRLDNRGKWGQVKLEGRGSRWR